MQINKKELQEALDIVKPGLASKEMIAQSTSFAFMNGCVVTYNDEISISHPIKDLELQGAIEAQHLYPFLSKIKSDTLNAEIVGNEIILKSGKSKAGLTLQSEIKLPLQSIFEEKTWYPLPDDFAKLVSFTTSSASHDMSKPILTCVHVHESGFVEASDSVRITKGTFGTEMPVETFLLPATSADVMVKLSPKEIAKGDSWVHFRTEEGTTLSCRIYNRDNFPNTEHLFVLKGVDLKLPKASKAMLEKAMIFAKREHSSQEVINLELSEGVMVMKSRSESGWFEEPTPIRYQGKEIDFSISPHLLKEILNESLACTLAKDRIKFEGANWVYIAMLRYKKKKETK